ncbi:uncharacterized protein [Gossypium hirsutum]|uniref:Myb/SANT-like domain-containing protein n=1 Tax=Gossypium hirsutum TaxID=3635 RepID=A0ABM2ZZJ7_GOSHI|nr:uncharacterized protein LOC121216091 [Gossypium hirsutum]
MKTGNWLTIWGKCLTLLISVRHFPETPLYPLFRSSLHLQYKTLILFINFPLTPQEVLHSFISSVPSSIIAVFFHFLGSLFSISVQITVPNVLSFRPPFIFAISTPISVRSVGNFRMGKGNKEGTSKQFRWTKLMEHVFLEILAEEARKGNKPSNTFKSVSINRVADAIFERFQVQCDTKHVENHLRTVKNQWQIICKIRGESGFGWDDNMKMITCDRATYDATVMDERCTRKRKTSKDEFEICNVEAAYEDGTKRLKKDGEKVCEEMLSEAMVNAMEQSDVELLMGSAAAKRQADRTQ